MNKASELPRVDNYPIIIDTETTGLNKMVDKPFLILISVLGKSYALRPENALPWLINNMPKAEYNVFHNAKYDIHMLLNFGLPWDVVANSRIWCTMVNETLIDDHRASYSLNSLCKTRFNVSKSDKELLEWLAKECGGKPDRKHQMKNIVKAPLEMVAKYGIGDVEMTEMLYKAQKKEVLEQDLGRVSGLEEKVLKVLIKLERRGVPINMKKVDDTMVEFVEHQRIVAEQIKTVIGQSVNVRSGKQLEKAFRSIGKDIKYNNETGNPVFDKETLEADGGELAGLILSERSYGTMINTFLAKFGEHVWTDGRIRCDFNQTKTDDYGVITGRLSASSPNLMQIPKRDKGKAAMVRSVFEAPGDAQWISADWKQFEFRVFAHYSRDENLISEFHNNPEADYHQLIADLTGLKRDPYAKQLNLGLVFGMGQGLMAKKCGLPYTVKEEGGRQYYMAGNEAKRIFGTYHKKLPGVRSMLSMAEKVGASRGYIKTMMGRRIRFINKNFAYKAGGYVFQGTSADFMKMKLVELENYFGDGDTQLVLPVHDEFDMISGGGTEKAVSDTREILQNIPQLRVPIRCDIGVAKDWWNASK